MQKEREVALVTKQRLLHINDDREEFLNMLRQTRLNLYKVRVPFHFCCAFYASDP